MKNLKYAVFTLIGLMSVTACDDLLTMNDDPKNPSIVPAGALFANATKDFFDFMSQPSVNVNNFRLWAQQWAQTTYADESNYDLITRNVNGNTWNTLYAEVIRDLREAKAAIEDNINIDATSKTKQVAMAEVMEIYAFHVLVDIFGDIPYKDALTDDVTPSYENDSEIYADLITRLNAAIGSLSGDSGMGASDLIYGGDAGAWRKFANSLKLRMAMRLVDVDATKAKTLAEQAVQDGVIESNDDNATIQYQSSTPNTNPLWVSLVQSGRSDYVAAATLVEPMEMLNDPRLPLYFRDQIEGEYVGGVYGDNNAYNAFSHPGTLQEDPTFPGIIMSAWEVDFLKADAAARGFNVGGTADQFYNNGITKSILYWGGTEADAAAYLANPGVAYASAVGTAQQKIAFQKWISLYDQGFEAWSTVRLYDYPEMEIAVLSELPTPKRYAYPVTEYSLNEDNVASAGRAMGTDAIDTPVFWDVN